MVKMQEFPTPQDFQAAIATGEHERIDDGAPAPFNGPEKSLAELRLSIPSNGAKRAAETPETALNDNVLRVWPPEKTAPGYLRRQRQFMDIVRRLGTGGDPTAIDDMLDWYFKHCRFEYRGPLQEGQTEREAITDILLELSEEDFMNLLKKPQESAVNPTSDAS